MKYMLSYDLMESVRNTNQWLGASARAFSSYPMMSMTANPMVDWLRAWGEVTERSFERMVAKPDWNIPVQVSDKDGTDQIVTVEKVIERPFGDLLHFKVGNRAPKPRRVLLIAPMSGHYATLVRKTVISLLPDCEVYVTDWHNARDIPVSAGKFDIEDSTLYLVDFMKELGSDLHVIAVCQPAPLTLAAVAYLAEEDASAQPRSMTLIGGPIDPDANPTDVTDFGHSVTMGQLEQIMIQRVGFKYAGVGRKVYPGLLQLTSFISMNASTHAKAFRDQIIAVAKGEASDHDRHNAFYDEYLAVMDMPAEFYLSTVERVFKTREIARNEFTVAGRKVDIGKITDVAVKIVEGEDDDISAPGQCLAALDLLTGLPDSKKAAHLEPGAGHYGIFAGGKWRRNIRPLVLNFIDANSDGPTKVRKTDAPATPEEKPALTTTGSKAETAKPDAKASKPADAPKADAPKPAKAKSKPASKADTAKPATAKAEAPKADARKADAPKAAETKAEPKTADAPKSEPAKAEAPKAAPKADAPKQPEAKPAAKAEASKAEAKKPDAPKADAKPADAPKPAAGPAEAPKTEAAKPADAKSAPANSSKAPTDKPAETKASAPAGRPNLKAV